MYKVIKFQSTDIDETLLNEYIETSREMVEQGSGSDLPEYLESRLKDFEPINDECIYNKENDYVIYSDIYVNATSNPLLVGYQVEVYIKVGDSLSNTEEDTQKD